MIKRIPGFIFLMLLTLVSGAQGDVTMADEMRNNGKIYVVVAVILAIFAGIIIYLIRLDRKISKLEKEKSVNQFLTK